jgi:hypothetical protein
MVTPANISVILIFVLTRGIVRFIRTRNYYTHASTAGLRNLRLLAIQPDSFPLGFKNAIYSETLGMYTHAVNRFWSESSFSLLVPPPRRHWRCPDHWEWCLYPLISSLNNDKLRMVTRLYVTGRELSLMGSWCQLQAFAFPRTMLEDINCIMAATRSERLSKEHIKFMLAFQSTSWVGMG